MSHSSPKPKTSKYCVFCGEQPTQKTKEHIIPQWLIKLTGSPNRVAQLTFNKSQFKWDKRPFSTFVFPACKTCNDKYAQLEGMVSSIVQRIIKDDYIFEEELSIFFDWLDKVRIGLWLGDMMLNKKHAFVKPKFHINERLGIKDRLIILFKASDHQKGLQFGGTLFPNFHFTPSCFSLTINNLYIINISYDLLFCRRLGFPYLKSSYYDPSQGGMGGVLVQGNHRIMKPILKYRINLDHQIFFQPCFSQILASTPEASDYYNKDYVVDKTLSKTSGLGKIFSKEGIPFFSSTNPQNLLINQLTEYERGFIENKVIYFVTGLQLFINKLLPSIQHLPIEERREIRRTMNSCDRFNKKLLKELLKILKG